MRFLFTSMVLSGCLYSLLTLFPASAAYAKTNRTPAMTWESARLHIVVKDNLKDPDQLAVVNTFNNSSIYAFSMNELLNGAGTEVEVGRKLESETFFQQVFRTFSLFDLYLTYAVRNANAGHGELAFSIVPLLPELSETLKPYKFQTYPSMLNDWWRFITPVTDEFVRAEPTISADYQNYVNDVRASIIVNLASRFPLFKDSLGENALDRAQYLWRSYEPLYSSSWLKLEGKNSSFKSTLLLPSLGVLDLNKQVINSIDIPQQMDSGAAYINRLTYGNMKSKDNNVIRLYTHRDFNIHDKFTVEVDFGRLAPQGTGPCNLIEDSQRAADVRHEDGLIAHGFLKIPGTGLDSVNKALKNIEIEISIHHLVLDLQRSTLNSKNNAETPASLIKDLPPFSLKDSLKVNGDETRVTFRIVSPNVLGLGNHAYTFGSSKLFWGFIDKFVNKQISKQVAVQGTYNIQNASDKMDSALVSLTAEVMAMYKNTQTKLAAAHDDACMLSKKCIAK